MAFGARDGQMVILEVSRWPANYGGLGRCCVVLEARVDTLRALQAVVAEAALFVCRVFCYFCVIVFDAFSATVPTCICVTTVFGLKLVRRYFYAVYVWAVLVRCCD